MEKKREVIVVNIVWECIEFDGVDFKKIRELNKNADYGLYQIYGHHPAYGDDALLYIGLASGQTFAQRINDRLEFYESSARPTNICIGRICESSEKQSSMLKGEWEDLISLSEKLLIKTHSPAMNEILYKGRDTIWKDDLLIINWGDYKRLLPEVSTLRMSWDYWLYERPIE